MVGAKGFEPSTSWSRTRRASQAALRPDTVRGNANSLLKRFHDSISRTIPATGALHVKYAARPQGSYCSRGSRAEMERANGARRTASSQRCDFQLF